MIKNGQKEGFNMNTLFKNFIVWFHLIQIIFVWFTPVLLSWYIIVLFILLNYLQIALLGDCVLTRIQFGRKNRKAYYTFVLEKLGFKPDNKKVTFFVINVKPYILLVLSLIWQIVLKNKPLIF